MAILVSAVFAAICIVVNKLMPEQALGILMSLVVSSLVINWFMISITHLYFRREKVRQGIRPKYAAFWFPVTNYICLIFLAGMLGVIWITGMKTSVELIPVWLLLLYLSYWFINRKKAK